MAKMTQAEFLLGCEEFKSAKFLVDHARRIAFPWDSQVMSKAASWYCKRGDFTTDILNLPRSTVLPSVQMEGKTFAYEIIEIPDFPSWDKPFSPVARWKKPVSNYAIVKAPPSPLDLF